MSACLREGVSSVQSIQVGENKNEGGKITPESCWKKFGIRKVGYRRRLRV